MVQDLANEEGRRIELHHQACSNLADRVHIGTARMYDWFSGVPHCPGSEPQCVGGKAVGSVKAEA